MNKQGGFTLVELAVVMVIIGILLSAILKGQDLIDNARAKKVLSDMKNFEAMIWGYYDRQGRFPGDCAGTGYMGLLMSPIVTAGTPVGADQVTTDDATATSPETLACDTTADASNSGIVAGTKDSPVADLRIEHLLDWTQSSDDSTEHGFIGNIHLTHTSDGAATPQLRNAIVVYNIPQWVGEMIDASIDGDVDGISGRIRYLVDSTPTAAVTQTGTAWPERTIANTEVAIAYYFDEIAPVP